MLFIFRSGEDRFNTLMVFDALNLSFYEIELLLKQRGLGQDLDIEELAAGRDLLRTVRPQ
jgi:hypothetical protein